MTKCIIRRIALSAILMMTASASAFDALPAIEKSGDILEVAMPLTAAGMTFGAKDYRGTLQLVGSEALATGITYGLKYTVHETRPNKVDDHSFPSGHTTAAFASAEFVRKRYGWRYGIPAYLLATYVGVSRVVTHWHYTHDVIAGAVIGSVSAFALTRTLGSSWTVGASFSKKSAALSLSGTF